MQILGESASLRVICCLFILALVYGIGYETGRHHQRKKLKPIIHRLRNWGLRTRTALLDINTKLLAVKQGRTEEAEAARHLVTAVQKDTYAMHDDLSGMLEEIDR